MLAFLNHFIVHTSGFLNRFSVICEEKLEDLSVRLQRLETTVCLLEAKVGVVVVAAALLILILQRKGWEPASWSTI